jgi:hypothetical protein
VSSKEYVLLIAYPSGTVARMAESSGILALDAEDASVFANGGVDSSPVRYRYNEGIAMVNTTRKSTMMQQAAVTAERIFFMRGSVADPLA